MKKNLFALFLFIIGFALISSNSYAATPATDATESLALSSSTHTQTNSVTVSLSANVHAGYWGADNAYGAATTNPLGNGKSFALSSATSYVYYSKVTEGTTTPTPVTAGQSTWSSGTWSVLGQ